MPQPEQQPLAVVILAAGKGTRMKSDLAKVLHPILGRPMLHYSLDLARDLGSVRTILVVGHQAARVERAAADYPEARFALQDPQLGTGHAVMMAAPQLEGFAGTVLVLCGDVPGLTVPTLGELIRRHRAEQNAMTVLAMDLPQPGSYGRLVTDPAAGLTAIVEYRDASEAQRAITLVNAGIYCFQAAPLLAGLQRLDTNNDQNEYYLTDLVAILRAQGERVGHAVCPDPLEVAGINSREELGEFEARLSQRIGA